MKTHDVHVFNLTAGYEKELPRKTLNTVIPVLRQRCFEICVHVGLIILENIAHYDAVSLALPAYVTAGPLAHGKRKFSLCFLSSRTWPTANDDRKKFRCLICPYHALHAC